MRKNSGKLEKQNQCKTSKQRKRLFKMYIKTRLYVAQNIQQQSRKSKVALKLSKPRYIGTCILELSKVLKYEFHYDYIKNKYNSKSKLLITDTDSLMYEIKTKDIYEAFNGDKECLTLVII